ncbi:MAG TPA: MauE/DoxX family redox-associated membrane protein [Acidimicrobiales bacterium]|nr:MauE/DoxX family redox-associated membrane protein [Acidimicrobiales bacterium]
MSGLASVSALLLAVTFAWAGASKIVTPVATRASFVALGVPAPGPMSRAVPAVELALSAALVVAPRPAAIAGGVMLIGFSVVLARAVARGVTVGCRCFGGFGAAPVSAGHLVRNGGLVVAAAVATGTDAVRVPPLEAVVVVSLVAFIIVLGVATLDLRRAIGAFWSVALPGETR